MKAERSYFSPNVTNGLKYYLATHDVAGLVDGRLRATMVTHMGRAYFNEIGKIDRQGSSPPSFSPRYAELTCGPHCFFESAYNRVTDRTAPKCV